MDSKYHIMVSEQKGQVTDMRDYRFVNRMGHIEVYDSWGQFVLSADNESEAMCELDDMLED